VASKLGRKEMPSGFTPDDFTYQGRPAGDQGDFDDDVGLGDMACVNQFGDANNSKYYHGGVVKASDGTWWVYLQWGRIKSGGKSWEGGAFREQDFQFVQCSDEAEARSFFKKQMLSKNLKRLIQQTIGGATVWTGKTDKKGKYKDGYIVQQLATRERGLPDAYGIKDSNGVAPAAKPKKKAKGKGKGKKAKSAMSRDYHKAEMALASALVGGTTNYTRALSKSSGVVPTQAAIAQVRDELIPAALSRCQAVGDDVARQVRDAQLQSISKMVFAMVPRHIPRGGLDEEQAVLNAATVLPLQQDLDAFEAALRNEDWSEQTTSSTPAMDPDTALNAKLLWLDPKGSLGAWVANTFRGMTRNRHGDLHGQQLRIHNMFAVERPDRDVRFEKAVKEVARRRKGRSLGHVGAGLQPSKRPDLGNLTDDAAQANLFIGIHGTRAVNVAPILQTHFRMPRSLAGVHITGAAFGHGIYFATDLKKSWGYTGYSGRWGGGGGTVSGRKAFMFLCDVVGGKFHYPSSAWGINTDKCPGGDDSVYAHPSRISSLQNDEHVIFHPDHSRIRYVVELDFS
jgi:hypothetical protein